MKLIRPMLIATAVLVASPSWGAEDECSLTVEANDQLQFNKKEMSVPASCESVTVTLKHVGKMEKKTMGHNWVLTASDDFKAVAEAGMQSSLENDYVPQDDERVIANTEVIGGGESTTVEFSTEGLADKELTFFCSFPGHSSIMSGTFRVEG